MMATTSTDNTGLLDELAPKFKIAPGLVLLLIAFLINLALNLLKKRT